jgi:ribosomal protein S18 acetylase RimI-like enzyme
MRRDLREPVPDVPMPEGLEVRPVRPEDHRAIWEADVEAFQDHPEAAVRNEEDLVRTYADPRTDTSLWVVAWEGDTVVGVVMNEINEAENEKLGQRIGWLNHVSVRRPWRGRGVATAICARSMQVLRDRGMDFAELGVDGENPTGALRVYEKLGFGIRQTWQSFMKDLELG